MSDETEVPKDEYEEEDYDEYDYNDDEYDDPKETMQPASAVVPLESNEVVDKPEEPILEEPEGPDFSIVGVQRAMLLGFLEGILERLKLVALLPGADASGDTSIQMDKINDGYEVLKAMMLDNAQLVLRPFHRGPKPSKFAIETKWLKDIVVNTIKEVEEENSFASLVQTVEEGEAREQRLPKALERIKALSSEMHEIRTTLQAEAAANKIMVREWNKTLANLKQGIKDLKKENKIQAKYREDILVATADCARRGRDVALKALREETEKLKNDIEVEKRVNTRALEFLKKQNLELMEEAISLQTGLDNDISEMDVMYKKIWEQREEKQKIVSELEPRYIEEMEQKKAEEEEMARQRDISIEQQGLNEMKLRATMRLQRTYRGFKARAAFKKELKKWKKKQKKDGKGKK